jgi:hypothetical protein
MCGAMTRHIEPFAAALDALVQKEDEVGNNVGTLADADWLTVSRKRFFRPYFLASS